MTELEAFLKAITRIVLGVVIIIGLITYYKWYHPDTPKPPDPLQVQEMQKANDLCGSSKVTDFKIDEKGNPTWKCQ